ncbi:MAG: hypothetical protein RMJ16_07085 [Thermoguttaceae bacterium]|nr:hypothetical protein [Thermoguttaceae bacterium]
MRGTSNGIKYRHNSGQKPTRIGNDWTQWSATASDPIAATLRETGHTRWSKPLWERGWTIPEYLAFDLGVLLFRPQVRLSGGDGLTSYARALIQVASTDRFRLRGQILQEAPRDLEDQAVTIAI